MSWDYTVEPTHVRVYREETGDDEVWHIDGADNAGQYTEALWRYATIEEALANVADFIELNKDSLEWKFDAARKTQIRMNS